MKREYFRGVIAFFYMDIVMFRILGHGSRIFHSRIRGQDETKQ